VYIKLVDRLQHRQVVFKILGTFLIDQIMMSAAEKLAGKMDIKKVHRTVVSHSAKDHPQCKVLKQPWQTQADQFMMAALEGGEPVDRSKLAFGIHKLLFIL
jgi:hypothetical protein